MNQLRKTAGIIWMILGPTAFCFAVWQAYQKLTSATDKIEKTTDVITQAAAIASKNNIQLQWAIIIGIFLPVAIGFVLFGYYAWKGEYNRP